MDRYRNARRGDARDLMGIGNQQQAQNQRDLDFAFQEFMREQNDPMMRLGAVQAYSSVPTARPRPGLQMKLYTKTTSPTSLGWGTVVGGLGSGGFFNSAPPVA